MEILYFIIPIFVVIVVFVITFIVSDIETAILATIIAAIFSSAVSAITYSERADMTFDNNCRQQGGFVSERLCIKDNHPILINGKYFK